ncbi:GNAT family N-acetyltransferase [Rossellomorea vietnamensis]|uniref:GNAT family N-acetyltransferase n=1 Tax=Rossellomorea vietnamensis TaxID=218284 RepID=A0A5D4P2A5_9BACI|nr:GNAT family N-acetyltransferase [Rossellomorea vietnamensis]TYS19856.1 GNAT family N-acetyltransferase [Rossellomorea vietnamensis]
MNIKRANINDARGIAKVQVDSWKTTYKDIVPDDYLIRMSYESRELKWKDIISNGGIVFVAENSAGEIVGFSSCGPQRDNKYSQYRGELYAIYILKEYQRSGLGKLLVMPIIDEFLKQEIFAITVIVLKDNNSRLFYEALGAEKIGTIDTEISGRRLSEFVYGWEDIRKII